MAHVRKTKKVLLVEPRGPRENVFSMFSGLPLMGPLYMGTILKKKGYDVTFINENLIGRDIEILGQDADVLLLSCLTSTVERGYEIASVFKRRNPNSLAVIGGPHVSFMEEEALKYADIVVKGEGESVVADIVAYGSDERVVHGSPVEDLDSLPIIDFSIMQAYNKLKIFPLMTSRGCPHACNFCCVTAMFGRKYRYQSAERVMDEMNQCTRGISFVYDDNFIANKRRSHELLDLLIKRGRKLPRWFACQVTTKLAKDRLLMEKMARAGFCRLYVGFESISDSSLKCLNKHHNSAEVEESVKLFHQYGMRIHGMFIFGTDNDNEEIIRSTRNFVRRAKISTVQYSILTPLPGTAVYNEMHKQNRILHRMWRYYDGMHVVHQPKNMTPYKLQKDMLNAFSDFYSVFQSVGEAVETVAECYTRLLTRIKSKPFGLPAIENALFKLGGKVIVKKWIKHNKDYLNFLKMLPARLKGLYA